MTYLMMFPVLIWVNHTSIMWEHCVNKPGLQLCFWGEFLQLKGVKLPWKQNSCDWRFHLTVGKPWKKFILMEVML